MGEEVPLEGAAEGVVVAAFDVVGHVPVPADQFGAAVLLDLLVDLAIILVSLCHRDSAFRLDLRHQQVFQSFHLPA